MMQIRRVAVNLNNMDALDQLSRDLGFDPDSPEQRLGNALAEGDLDLLDSLVRLRVAKRMTQQDVADAMKRNKSAVSRFEALDSDPRLSTIRRYARAIGALVEHKVGDFENKGSEDQHEAEAWKSHIAASKSLDASFATTGIRVHEVFVEKVVKVYGEARNKTPHEATSSEWITPDGGFIESSMK